MWFTEDPWPPMLICGLAGLLGIAWWSSSKRIAHLALGLGCFALGGLIYVAEGAIVTPVEIVEQRVTALCHEFQRKDARTLDHFSATAPQLRLMCQTAMNMVEVGDDLRLADFHTRLVNAETRAICHFRANATLTVNGFGNAGRQPGRFEMTWAKEHGDWKIIALRRLNPVKDEEMPLLEQTPG